MMDEPAFWVGEPLLVVNFNVSWNQYDFRSSNGYPKRSIWLSAWVRIRAESIAGEKTSPGFAHYFSAKCSKMTHWATAPSSLPRRLVLRMKHLMIRAPRADPD